MKSSLIIASILFGLYFLSLVVPADFKNQVLAAIGLSGFSLSNTFTTVADRVSEQAGELTERAREAAEKTKKQVSNLVPKSPAEKRQELLDELGGQLGRLKEIDLPDELAPESKERITVIVEGSERIIEQIKDLNEEKDEGVVGSVIKATAGALSGAGGEPECECNGQ